MTDAERTEQPTPKREREFRERGQIAFSRDAAMVAGLAGTLLAGHLALPGAFADLQLATKAWIARASSPEQALADPRGLFLQAAGELASGCGALILATGALGVGASVLQTRGAFAWKRLGPDFKHVDPVAGMKRLLSPQALVEALKGLLKAVLLGVAVAAVATPWLDGLAAMMEQPLPQSLAAFGETASRMLKVSVVLLGVLAGADYMYQWWSMRRQMRMTRQEVLDEHKQEEGDPYLRGRRRMVHRAMVTGNRLVQAIAESDVVVTNPDHVAVALAYVLGRHRAPVVMAMGVDARAERIKRLARERGIPRVENRALARLMVRTCREGMEVPESLYTAVAEVIAFVHRVRGLRGDRALGATR